MHYSGYIPQGLIIFSGQWTLHKTIYHHISPYITIYHHISPYITIYHHISPYITIYHHISPYIICVLTLQSQSNSVKKKNCIRSRLSDQKKITDFTTPKCYPWYPLGSHDPVRLTGCHRLGPPVTTCNSNMQITES